VKEDPINFSSFIFGLASTTLIHLGVAPHPETGQPSVDLTLAQQSLTLLELLREKTRGNLDAEEERLFANLLTELRLKFVEATKRT
jgi:hypothetical protein